MFRSINEWLNELIEYLSENGANMHRVDQVVICPLDDEFAFLCQNELNAPVGLEIRS